MGFTSDITEYKQMLHEYDRRGAEMRRAREERYRMYTRWPEPERKPDYYTSVNGVDMSRDEYATYTREMYEANGEEYPGQMYEALAGIYRSTM